TATGRWSQVEVAEDIDALTERAGQIADGDRASAILMPWRERASEQHRSTGGHLQRVETEFAVGIVIRHYDQLMGGARALRFDALKSDVERTLAGWQPTDRCEPCELVGGESSPIDRGVSIYVQTWAAAR